MYEETPWTFDANDVSDRPYTSERSGDAPSFESGAEVTVSNADEKSVVVSFPSAVSADETDNNDMISRYKVVLTDQETESSVTRYVFADYYRIPIAAVRTGTLRSRDSAREQRTMSRLPR